MKNVFLAIVVAVMGMGFYGCNGQKTGTSAEKQEVAEVPTMSVDEVLLHADSLVGKKIAVEGRCSHVCKFSGKKAFLMSESSESMLRAEAIGVDSFPKASTDHVLRIEGIVAEERVDEAAVKKMEENYGLATQSHGANAEVGCNAEKAAQNQLEINSFAARMQDYRDRIAERQAKEGKAYLSFYYAGGALGSHLPIFIYEEFGWGYLCAGLSFLLFVLALLFMRNSSFFARY